MLFLDWGQYINSGTTLNTVYTVPSPQPHFSGPLYTLCSDLKDKRLHVNRF